MRQKVVSGMMWSTFERFGTQIVGLVISMILARLLGPSDYGVVAYLTIFIAVANVFVDSGFGKALVQGRDIDQTDYDTIFIFNVAMGILAYVCLCLASPWVASFYNEPILKKVLPVSALCLVIGSFNCVQNAILVREMKFYLSFRINLSGLVTHGIVGTVLAYKGFSYWSLVWSQLASGFVSMLLRWVLVAWRPTFQFSFARLRKHFLFSSNLLFSSLLDTGFNQIYGLLIGKWYSKEQLSLFSRGDTLPGMIMGCIQGVIGGVSFPALSRMQDDRARMRKNMRILLKGASALSFPSMFGLAAVAPSLIDVWLGDKWTGCVPFLQIACLTYAFWPVHVSNLQVIQACGRSDIFFRLEIIKKVVQVLAIVLTFKHGLWALIIGKAAVAPIGLLINGWPNKKLIDYSIWRQLWDISPAFSWSMLMFAGVYSFNLLQFGPLVKMLVQVASGALLYMVFLRFGMRDQYSFFAGIFKDIGRRMRK